MSRRRFNPGPLLVARYETAKAEGRWEDAEEAARLLALHRRCRSCGRPLSDPVSVDRGIGPECERRAA